MRSRRKKKRSGGVIIAILMLLALGGLGYCGFRLYSIFGPNRARVAGTELFGVPEDRTAVMYNYELQDAEALTEGGTVYLPADWVIENINRRFYRDGEEGLLLYALPDRIVKMEDGSADDAGALLFFERDGALYLSLPLIRTYTGVRAEVFFKGPEEGAVGRIFLSDPPSADTVAEARRKTAVRTRPSRKGLVVDDVPKGARLRVIPDHPGAATGEDWQRVMTETGFTGYIEKKALREAEELPYEDSFEEERWTHEAPEKTIVLGWHQVTNSAANAYFESAVRNAAPLNVISPTWFSLRGNEGEYECIASAGYVAAAHARGIEVWALIDNFDESVTLGTLLRRTSVREKLIASLMADAERYGFDGINLDFEYLKADAAPQYLEFVRELAVSCREKGLTLSADVPNPASFNLHYGRAELGEVCDYVINMGYDEHTAGDGMGSTSSMAFFENGLARSAEEVPAERLIAGIPFYTRIWTEAQDGTVTSEAITMENAADWAARHDVALSMDQESGQFTGSLEEQDGTVRHIWMEDALSVRRRIGMAREAGTGGIACWRLGAEPAEIWDTVSELIW